MRHIIKTRRPVRRVGIEKKSYYGFMMFKLKKEVKKTD